MKRITLLCVLALILTPGRLSFAHCDGMDGPVIQAAQKALATEDLNLVLIWVQPADEHEIGHAFAQTLAVRKLGPEARELADDAFFETLVRVHRAGEGAAFTGLKPAGQDIGPVIPAADKALEKNSPDALIKLVTADIEHRLREHYNAVVAKKKFASDDVAAGREFVKAYVAYVHFVEGLHQQVTKSAHGHFAESSPASDHEHH